MSQSPSEQRTSYPLSAYNFRVTISGAAMRFARVTGLQREHRTVTYRHGLSFAEGEQITKFHIDAYQTVTLEQGTVAGHKFLTDWLESSEPTPMEIGLCDETGVPVVVWSIVRALPVRLSAPTLDASSNQVSIDSLEIRAAGISVKHLV